MKTNARIGIVTIVVILAVIAFALYRANSPSSATTPPKPIATAFYACDAGKNITAAYYEGVSKAPSSPGEPPIPGGSVNVTLSDGRSMTLPQTISADGTRYANTDESFVFWSKGNGALVLENNVQKSFTGCIEVKTDPGSLPQVYQNSADGISVRYPQGYVVDEKYSNTDMGPGKEISGIKFTIPSSLAKGTNLSNDTYLSFEAISKVKKCDASAFLDANAPAHVILDGDTTYSVASTTGAGAGNRYEQSVYVLPGTNPCIAVRYFIHYGAIDNYPKGAVKEFDRQALLSQFDSIRRTLTVVQ